MYLAANHFNFAINKLHYLGKQNSIKYRELNRNKEGYKTVDKHTLLN